MCLDDFDFHLMRLEAIRKAHIFAPESTTNGF
jgi:hypothetical protein